MISVQIAVSVDRNDLNKLVCKVAIFIRFNVVDQL